MKTEIIKSLVGNFESYAKTSDEGVEFWLARDLQQLLGYAKWDNFISVISKAKTACEITEHTVSDHFADVGKTIQMPKGAQKEVPDIMLTRYACYLIAQNGDPKKEEISFAQNYFAVQTRKFEIIEKRKEFLSFVLSKYEEKGVEELDEEKLPVLLNLKYNAIADAVNSLGEVDSIRSIFFDFQKDLYQAVK